MLVDSWQTSTQLIYLCQLVIGKWAWNIVVCATLSHGSPAWIVAALIGGWNKWHRALSLAKSGLMVHKGWLVLVETSGKPNLPVPSSYQKKRSFWWRSSAVYQWGARRKAFRPMRAQAASCWTNQSVSLHWSTWKNVVSKIGQTVNFWRKIGQTVNSEGNSKSQEGKL